MRLELTFYLITVQSLSLHRTLLKFILEKLFDKYSAYSIIRTLVIQTVLINKKVQKHFSI